MDHLTPQPHKAKERTPEGHRFALTPERASLLVTSMLANNPFLPFPQMNPAPPKNVEGGAFHWCSALIVVKTWIRAFLALARSSHVHSVVFQVARILVWSPRLSHAKVSSTSLNHPSWMTMMMMLGMMMSWYARGSSC